MTEHIPSIPEGNLLTRVFGSALVLPFAVFCLFYFGPLKSVLVEDHLMYSMLQFIMIGFSLYTAYYYYRSYTREKESPRLFLYSLSVLLFGLIYVVHSALALSNGTSLRYDMLFDITEHYGLFFSAALFAGATWFREGTKEWLYKNRLGVYLGVVSVIVAAALAVFFSDTSIKILYEQIPAASVVSGILLLVAAALLAYEFLKTHNVLTLYFVFGLAVMANASYTPLVYAEWDVVWWYSHLVIAAGFSAIFVGVINYHRHDLGFNLFFGEIPFYKKIGSKLAIILFVMGLLPLLVFGSIAVASTGNVLGHLSVAELHLLVFRLMLAFSLLFVLAGFFAFYFATKLITPLRELREAVGKVAGGNDDIEVHIRTGDEIEILADSFNTMTVELKRLHGGLEKTIQEQTKELNEKLLNLEDTKKAMFNLLEDSKILEGKLAEEKANVEQKVVERTRELSEEKARMLASIESLSFGFIIADTEDKVILKNPAIMSILELTEEPTSVRSIVDSFKGVASGIDVLERTCRECVDLGKAVELKEVSHGKKYLRVFCTPIIVKDEAAQDGKDRTIGYVILVEDITEAKIMERSRDEFFAVASHELRTPLTAIRGNADMLLEMYADKITDSDMKEMLQDIDLSSVRLISVVNDFLEASRLEQGRIDIKKENFNVSDTVIKVVRDLKAMIEKKGLSIAYTPPASPLPSVFADKDRTEQIIVNLIGNAIKFTKEGGITITTEVEGDFVATRVIDTGLGISEHNQALLFRKFQQAGEQMLARDVTQSTGLGLYISRLIISSMGGTIGLEKSELGKGSTFTFTLPVAK